MDAPEQPDSSAPLSQPEAPTTHLPHGVVGLDLGPALHAAEVLELLRGLGLEVPPK